MRGREAVWLVIVKESGFGADETLLLGMPAFALSLSLCYLFLFLTPLSLFLALPHLPLPPSISSSPSPLLTRLEGTGYTEHPGDFIV